MHELSYFYFKMLLHEAFIMLLFQHAVTCVVIVMLTCSISCVAISKYCGMCYLSYGYISTL